MSRAAGYLILFMFSLGLIGCQRQNDLETQEKAEEKNSEEMEGAADIEDYPDFFTAVLPSGVNVEAKINTPALPEGGTASVYQADLLTINTEKLPDLLMNGTEITYREQEQLQENGEKGVLRYYTGADGSELISADDTWIRFSTGGFSHIRIDFELDDEQNLSEKEDFSFASQSEADRNIRSLLNTAGISLYSEYDCIPIEYETLRDKNLEQYDGLEDVGEFQKDFLALKAVPWSEDYDCYSFTYYAAANGWKIGSDDREISSAIVPGSVIRVAYTRNGIQCLEISSIYEEQKVIETSRLITLEEALAVVNKKYDSIIMQGDYKITEIELEYVADIKDDGETYLLVPVWKCDIVHQYSTPNKNTDDIIQVEKKSVILINAVKGTEMYIGGSI